MAETLARRGALTVLPQDVAPEAVAEIVAWIKSRHPVWDTPLVLHTGDAVADVLNLLPKRAHGTVVVVDDAGRPVGTVDEAACTGVDRFTRLADVLDPAPLTLPLDTAPREVFEALGPRGVALGLDGDGRLAGLLTALGARARRDLRPGRRRPRPAADGGRGRHQRRRGGQGEGAARRRGRRAGRRHRARPPGEDARRAAGRAQRRGRRPARAVPVVAGNVVTADGVRDLAAAGADIVKVGVGPGAMCTTRMMTGVGRPQFSAVLECAAAGREHGVRVWADGGVRHPRDVALALAAGRLGGDDRLVAGRHLRVARRPAARRVRAAVQGVVRDGVQARGQRPDPRRRRLRPGPQGAVRGGHLHRRASGSTRSARAWRTCSTGSARASARPAPTPAPRTLDEFAERAVVGVQTAAGFTEGKPLML